MVEATCVRSARISPPWNVHCAQGRCGARAARVACGHGGRHERAGSGSVPTVTARSAPGGPAASTAAPRTSSCRTGWWHAGLMPRMSSGTCWPLTAVASDTARSPHRATCPKRPYGTGCGPSAAPRPTGSDHSPVPAGLAMYTYRGHEDTLRRCPPGRSGWPRMAVTGSTTQVRPRSGSLPRCGGRHDAQVSGLCPA
jgi:hypothetical protein